MSESTDQLLLIAKVLGALGSVFPLVRAILNVLNVIEAGSEGAAPVRMFGMVLNVIPGALTFVVTVAGVLGTDLVEMAGMDPEFYDDIV